MQVETLATEDLGDRTYIAHDGRDAAVIDPQRDLDRLEALLDERGLTVRGVFETHIHNDYVTGGYELARRTGAAYVLSAADNVSFDRHGVHDGDELSIGTLAIRAVSTPGHTDTHMSYAAFDGAQPAGAQVVFTGGSLLYGSVGRTDLIDPARTDELTRAQYRSARRLARLLPDDTSIYPTHGFGSFCSAGPSTGGNASTIGIERSRNNALLEDDEDAFVERLVAGLTAYPAYYAQMAPLNRGGPLAADLSPAPMMSADDLRSRIANGEWVVDLRDRTAYALDHLRGTVGIELGGSFATYVGWLSPWGSPVTLIGSSREQVADAQRQLVRIGIDRPAGAAIGPPEQLLAPHETASYDVATFRDLASRLAADGSAPADGGGAVVLDVRRPDEHAEASIPGSVNIPLYQLTAELERPDALPKGQVWVHCLSGFRASIAASLLDRAGYDVVLIDDHFDHAVSANLARRD